MGSGTTRRVRLREEHVGPDHRYLWAYMDDDGNLHIDGQDLGPLTAVVSGDGEYEWFRTIRAEELPLLRVILGCDPGADVLEVLEARYAGSESYELERLIRVSEIPSELHTWGG
jgi:hypothetical protein